MGGGVGRGIIKILQSLVKQTKPSDSPIPLSSLFIAGGGRRSYEFQGEWRVDHSSLTEYKGGRGSVDSWPRIRGGGDRKNTPEPFDGGGGRGWGKFYCQTNKTPRSSKSRKVTYNDRSLKSYRIANLNWKISRLPNKEITLVLEWSFQR